MRDSALSDDEPLYDSVASDDDYYNIDDKDEKKLRHLSMYKAGSKERESLMSMGGNSISATLQRSKSLAAADREPAPPPDYAVLKEQLESSEKKVQALIASNDDMRSELAKTIKIIDRV